MCCVFVFHPAVHLRELSEQQIQSLLFFISLDENTVIYVSPQLASISPSYFLFQIMLPHTFLYTQRIGILLKNLYLLTKTPPSFFQLGTGSALRYEAITQQPSWI